MMLKSISPSALALVSFLIALSMASNGIAQRELLQEIGVVGSVLDETPFDIITLTKEASGRSVRVNTIDFPGRKVPTDAKGSDVIQVTLPIFPDRNYEVSWKDIAKITLFEQLVLQQANKLVEEKSFAEAFEHFMYLRTNYPKTPGLQELRRDFLFNSAMEMSKQKRLPHTLAVLEELQRAFPGFKSEQVRTAISNVAGQLIKSYFDNNDLATARNMIIRLENDYKKSPLKVVDDWKKKLLALAKTYEAEAIEQRDLGEFSRARVAASRMLDIAPEIEGGRELLNELILAYPIIRVGVFQTTDRPDPASLGDWPAMRIGKLVSNPLFEFRSTGPEGGVYRFTLGSFQHSDDRTELDMMIQNVSTPGVPNSLELSQAILSRATVGKDDYVPGWAAIVDSVSVFGPERLKLKLRRPHVLPQAFLQWQLKQTADPAASMKSLYLFKSEESDRKRFAWARDSAPVDFQPKEIQEIFYTDPQRAISDMMRGEIDVIDRLFPADAKTLRTARNINLEPYALPMVHMLIPKTSNVYLDDREFRRALLYAINREGILNGEILGGTTSNQSGVISGPFPRGSSESDPVAYAYNNSVETVAYDPRVAKVLVMLSKAKVRVLSEKRQEKPPEIPTIKLGVPNYESARVAGEAIVQQWKLVEIPAELVVLDSMPDPSKECPVDILYVSAAIWEPATDAERLFGIGGPAASNNQFIVQALGKLNSAKNWREVSQGCQNLHALVATHLPILPLWQVGETFAYRNEVIGISKKPIGLYQDVQKWRFQLPR